MDDVTNQAKVRCIEDVSRYKEQHRCMRCKKSTLEQCVVCDKCLEFEYCSMECRVQDDLDHAHMCTVIGLKKGILYVREDPTKARNVLAKARVLDDEGDLKLDEVNEEMIKLNKEVSDLTMKEKKAEKDENFVQSCTKSGKFGGRAKCDSGTNSGETFGESWFKPKVLKEEKTQGSTKSKYIKTSVRVQKSESSKILDNPNPNPKSEVNKGEPEAGLQASGGSQVESSGLELVVKAVSDSNSDSESESEEENLYGRRQETKPRAEQKICEHCKNRSTNLKTCSRCKVTNYCNKTCQLADFKRHKEMCKRGARYISVCQKIPQFLMLEFNLGLSKLVMSLLDVPSELDYVFFRSSASILLEMVGPYFHPFRHGVEVMDLEGNKSHVMFYDPMNVYFHAPLSGFFGLPIPLAQCLTPGRFILLKEARWHSFLDGTVGFRIDDLSTVYFVM